MLGKKINSFKLLYKNILLHPSHIKQSNSTFHYERVKEMKLFFFKHGRLKTSYYIHPYIYWAFLHTKPFLLSISLITVSIQYD